MLITYRDGFSYPECSEGFTVSRNGVNYFLTAGHCTGSFTGGTSRTFFQPFTPDTVGQVFENPAWSTVGCAPGAQYCNTVDVAMVSFTPGMASQKYVNTTSVIGSGDSPGDRWIASIKPVNFDDGLGTWVFKTGNTSGTTQGPITAFCVDLPAYNNPGDPPHSLTCQEEAQLYADGGDSGGPVMVMSGEAWNAAGILHSRVVKSDGHYYAYFSSMSSIKAKFPGIIAY